MLLGLPRGHSRKNSFAKALSAEQFSPMSTVQEIESAIDRLPPQELLALVDRLRERHAKVWDLQIEADAQNGRLDALFARLERENTGQPEIPLHEVLDDGKLS